MLTMEEQALGRGRGAAPLGAQEDVPKTLKAFAGNWALTIRRCPSAPAVWQACALLSFDSTLRVVVEREGTRSAGKFSFEVVRMKVDDPS